MRRLCLPALAGLIALCIAAGGPTHVALAVQPDEMLGDAQLEARARALSRELRCMVCQNQSIDDSDAPLARDLRLLVRERLQHGDTDGQVIAFLSARYGDFVLLRPRWTWRTALLWASPLLAFALGIVLLAINFGRRKTAPAPAPLRPDEEDRLRKALES